MKILEEYSTVKENEGVEMRYFYRLTQSQYQNFHAYGVEITREDYKGIIKVGEDKDCIELISTQKHRVKQMVMNLYQNEVSPIHLVDILGEFVDGQVHEFDIGLIKEA
ncbi:MAG: hypothetical protein E7208_00770 [Clostridium butyricum]|nr:hypothetical protein [Clostridium butyricum]